MHKPQPPPPSSLSTCPYRSCERTHHSLSPHPRSYRPPGVTPQSHPVASYHRGAASQTAALVR